MLPPASTADANARGTVSGDAALQARRHTVIRSLMHTFVSGPINLTKHHAALRDQRELFDDTTRRVVTRIGRSRNSFLTSNDPSL
jgi:hypothetical protein